ncbi:hypothetical protein AVO45_13630 [Ruegeria marisrubri]|uniref:Cyclic nucleotide-binding protein n=1 Tax=Ruegeria marisrubri TaxID=1685379 RepID=A0A0X3TH62_9RHOB|nr:Crp/Fnr family transcriptional regulator [Ruegeria marisrubri]KUJ73636.1 hypothetical protein AVO45_13630 [Ruegeria marisrubri]
MSMAITDTTLFEQLSQKVRDCLLSKARVQEFDRGATICLQGEPTKTMKVVQSGWVKLYRVSPNGGEAVLATLSEGQSFNEISALQGRRSPTSAEAVSDCAILNIDLANVLACPDAYREVTQAVLSAASNHIDALLDDIEQLKVKTGAQRLSDYLLSLSEAESGLNEIVLPFEKTLLAGKLGMKPESLSRAFGRLKRYGVTSNRGHVRINDVSVLRSYAEQDSACA